MFIFVDKITNQMAETPTKEIELGFKAPEFRLKDVISGEMMTFEDVRESKGTLIVFICNHCPFVKHIMDELVKVGKEYMPRGIGMAMIMSNDVDTHPQDSPEKMKEFAQEKNFPFPYLYDETQQVAKDYHAACTPDFNLFDRDGHCVYRGQFDDSRPGNDKPVNGQDIRVALDAVLGGYHVPEPHRPSTGCNIKWKK